MWFCASEPQIIKMTSKASLLSIFIILGSLTAVSTDDCLMEALVSFIEQSTANRIEPLTDIQSQVVRSLKSKANISKMALLEQIKSNYELMPPTLKQSFDQCVSNSQSLVEICEKFYGGNNCELLSKFIAGEKCPQGFEREDHGSCLRTCQSNQIVISAECRQQEIHYIDEASVFKTEAECISEKRFCEKQGESFVQTCGPHETKAAFICIPQCMHEMSQETLKALRADARFCVKDSVRPGVNVYAF